MPVENTTFEKHFRIGELAEMWGLGRETVRKLVKDDPGVIGWWVGKANAKLQRAGTERRGTEIVWKMTAFF